MFTLSSRINSFSPLPYLHFVALGRDLIFYTSLCDSSFLVYPPFHRLWRHLVGYLLHSHGLEKPIFTHLMKCKKPSSQFSPSDLSMEESICVGSPWLLGVDPSLLVSRITASWQTYKNNTLRWSVLPQAFQWLELNRNGWPITHPNDGNTYLDVTNYTDTACCSDLSLFGVIMMHSLINLA